MASLVQMWNSISNSEFNYLMYTTVGIGIKTISDAWKEKEPFVISRLFFEDFSSSKLREVRMERFCFGVTFALSKFVLDKGIFFTLDKLGLGRREYSLSKRTAFEIVTRSSAMLAASALHPLIISQFSDTAAESFSELATTTMTIMIAHFGWEVGMMVAQRIYAQSQAQRRQNLAHPT
jgi:hypothetical protein